MSDMKCPFCQRKLKTFAKYKDGTSTVYCSKCNLFGDSKLFSELIRTHKALGIAVDALDAGRTLARIAGFEMLATGMDEAVNKITALEQKG